MEPAGQLVVASDIRNTLFRRALSLLDEVHAGIEDFNFVAPLDDSLARPRGDTSVTVSSQQGTASAGALVLYKGGDPLERVLATFLQGRTTTARRAVGAVAQVHSEIEGILSSFERGFPPKPAGAGGNSHVQEVNFQTLMGQPFEEVLRMAAATTAAAARFRVRAAEAARSALHVYDNAAKQAATAAQATTQALEMQILAEQHSAAGNLPQALDSIRQANRLRDESAEAARLSRQFQKEYARQRREAQEAHLQADAAMRHAYRLEQEALKSSSEAAGRQYVMWKDRYDRLAQQAGELRAQAGSLDAEADSAVARAEQAQHQADAEMADGNFDSANVLMQEAVRAQEQAGYARAQAKAARDSLQRLMPDLQAARKRMEEAEHDLDTFSKRQEHLQDATAKQRMDRLNGEADELAALCAAAEGAGAMHEDLVRVYEERLAEDREQYDKLTSEGRIAEADALAVHIRTWEELLDMGRKNLNASRADASAMRKRLAELSKADVTKDPAAAIAEGADDFQQLREAKDREALAAQAVAILARGLSSTNAQDAALEGAGQVGDRLLLQTEMHRQRIARLAEQMDKECQRLQDGHALPVGDGQPANGQAEAILDSIAMSHLVGTLETTRLLQLWKQRSEQAAASAEEMRKTWAKLEQDATAKADEALRLEEQALTLEMAGHEDQASSTMAQAEHLHRLAEQLRLEADKAKSAFSARETAADNAQAQSRSLVQGLYDVEHAAERLQSELARRGYNIGNPSAASAPPNQAVTTMAGESSHQGLARFSPLEVPSAEHEEMSTVMMASPGILSRSSSAATRNANLSSSADGHVGAARERIPLIALSSSFPSAADTPEELPSLRQLGQLAPASADSWSGGSSITSSHRDCIRNQDARLAPLIQELESHAVANAPAMSICRWEGHAGLILALQKEGGNEDAVIAISSDLVALREQLTDSAVLVKMYVQRDEQRRARWQELAAALQNNPGESVAQVADRALRRCAAVATASKITEDALALQANCHETLASSISSYRRALANQRMAAEAAKFAHTEAVSLQRQVQDAQAMEAELAQQVQALQEQLVALESEGSAGQALTVHFELQRLQNKHSEAVTHANQLTSTYKILQQRADEAHKKEADASMNLQIASRTVTNLANAAKEAAAGVQHAVEAYRHAATALRLGAKADLSHLGSGGANGDISNEDADVQAHLQRHTDCIRHAQTSFEATRRLQQLADNNTDPMDSQAKLAGGLASIAVGMREPVGERRALGHFTLTRKQSGTRDEKRTSLGSTNADDKPTLFGSSSLLLRPSLGDPPGPADGATMLGRSPGEQEAMLGSKNSLLWPSLEAIKTAQPADSAPSLGLSSRVLGVMSTGIGAQASGDNDRGDLPRRNGEKPDSVDAPPHNIAFQAFPVQGSLSTTRAGDLDLPGQNMSAPGNMDTLSVSMPSVGQPRLSILLGSTKLGLNVETAGLPASNAAISSPAVLLSAYTALRAQGTGLASSGASRSSLKMSEPDGPGSLQTVLSDKLLRAFVPNDGVQDADDCKGKGLVSGPIPAGDLPSCVSDQAAASLGTGSLLSDPDSSLRPFLGTGLLGQMSGSTRCPSVKPLGVNMHEMSGGAHGKSLESETFMAEGVGKQSVSALAETEPTAEAKSAGSSAFQGHRGPSPSTSSGATALPPRRQESEEVGHNREQGWKITSEELSTAATAGRLTGPEEGPYAQDVMVIKAELFNLHVRHQHQRKEFSALRAAKFDETFGLNTENTRRELEAELQEAELQLQDARAEQESLYNASPRDVQASNDRLCCHEQRVALLRQALEACDELANDRESLDRLREETEMVELEAAQCDETLALLAKAADMCSKTTQELHFKALDARNQARPGVHESLTYDVQGTAVDIAQRQLQAHVEAACSRERRQQLNNRLAVQQAAVKLRQDWMQQARKAAAAAVNTMDWDTRLSSARVRQQRLEAPVQELQEKATAASDAAQRIASAAVQHRNQAADLARQVQQQRQEARRFAAEGRHLEAAAAESMADSLQQQVSGLLAEAARMEGDAQELLSEAQELDQAVGRARSRVAAQSEVVQQVSRAHQLSALALQCNCTAAQKLHDALRDQAVVAQQQVALAQTEQGLLELEGQNPEAGGGTRPDELASHMIHVVRAKQEASRMRAALLAAQQQVDKDREAASAAARKASKAEEARSQLEPGILELELQAKASLRSAAVKHMRPSSDDELPGDRKLRVMGAVMDNPTNVAGDPPSTSTPADSSPTVGDGNRLAIATDSAQLSRSASHGPHGGDGAEPGPRVQPRIQSLREADTGTSGDRQSGLVGRVQLSGITRTLAVADGTQEATAPQLRVGLPIVRADKGKSDGETLDGATSALRRNQSVKRAASPPTSAAKIRGDGSLAAGDNHGNPNKWRVAVGAVNAVRNLAVSTPPPARHVLGANQQQPPTSGVSSPTGSVVGVAGAKIDWSPRDPASMRASGPRQEDTRSERSYSHTSIPSAGGPPQNRSHRFRPPTSQPEEAAPSMALQRVGTFRSPDRSPDQDDSVDMGTAGALLDKVANKSLKPLSQLKIVNAAGKPVVQPYQMRDSTTSFESSSRGSSATGSDARTGSARSSSDGHSDGKANSETGSIDEGAHMEDNGTEPDSKMYRTIKQRVNDLEGRIMQLRRQGDTSRTAAEILTRKQEQRRADRSAAVDMDEALQEALMQHGDAMIGMKEAESGLCHREADFLEEEIAACKDALQYAVIDWHFRREMKRLDERCMALAERAQSRSAEGQAFDAEVADASECVMLATSKAGRGTRAYTATLEQQQLERFIEEQQERLNVARQRAAERRSEAAQIANLAKRAVARKLLAEKKALCNKALYHSAVELADAFDHAAKIVAKTQHVKLHGMKATADALADRVQQLEAEIAAQQEQNAKSSAGPGASKLRSSQPSTTRSGQQNEEVLAAITHLCTEVEQAIQQCLQELLGETSDVIAVHRRRMDQICALVRLYQQSYDFDDHTLVEATTGEPTKSQPPSEAARRAAQITAAQEAVHDLDRACGIASQLRTLTLAVAEAHIALFELRVDPNAIRALLLGQKAASHEMDREELDARKQRLALLELEIPLARDQLTGALQVHEYRKAAAQLMEACKELQFAASVAAEAVNGLDSTIAVHRENIAMMHRHFNAAVDEAHIFTANGNVLQAAAAEEAAQRLAKAALAAETSLAAMVQEAQLKRDEQSLAGAAAEELQQVADGSLELVGLLLRIVSLQQEARTVSHSIQDLDGEQARLEEEHELRKSQADYANKQADQLQHESLQCRTNLKFGAADALADESRQCRASAQEHLNAAEVAKHASATAARQYKSACHRRKQLLREVHLLHTAAGHLQGALSCMRDKHHLVRKLRDVEHQRRHGQQAVEASRSTSPSPVPEIDVLQTQINASDATVKHHLASKTSYTMAADNLRLASTSLDRQGVCAVQADSVMQDVTKARVAVGTTGIRSSVTSAMPVLTDGNNDLGAAVVATTAMVVSPEVAVVQRGKHEDKSLPALRGETPGSETKSFAALQLQQAELRYRCLRGSLMVLGTIAAAAERASEARCRQVDLSDQAAVLVSDLAAKILEAEACANEAASLEAAVRMNAAILDEDDEENVKVKLMLNALLQKAESYRNEALLLQGRIKELEEQERAAGLKAADMEDALNRLQADHRHALDALDLAERTSQSRAQEAASRNQMQTLAAEVAQLEREAKLLENKIAQLRQQLTNASHTACSEDVANLMLVVQQIDTKLGLHKQVLGQRRLELESSRAECERLSAEINLMTQRTEHVLHASETQEQVQQLSSRVAELQSDLSSAHTARTQCERMLNELRQQYVHLAGPEVVAVSEGDILATASRATVRQSQQVASTQAAIALAEQMLEAHMQRIEVLQDAVAAWEAAKQRQEALLRHQEQLMQQDTWRSTLEQHRDELRKAASVHTEKAQQLRASAEKCSSGAALLLTAGPDAAERSNRSITGTEALSAIRAQAATIRAASEAALQHARAEAEDALSARAAVLANDIDRELENFQAALELAQPMFERLYLAANAAVSVARLRLVCVSICSDQGTELSTMHDALSAVRDLAAKIQGLLEAAERHTRAGHNMEAATARGQATAVQDALQHELKAVRSCKQRLTDLVAKLQGAKQELYLADKRMAQVSRSAAAVQSVTEYVHRACELRYECGERQWGTLQLLCQAADAMERAEVARQELKASQEAEKYLSQAGKRDSAAVVGQAITTSKRSLMEAEAERRLFNAQAVHETNACISEVTAAGLYMELANLTVKLLRHMDELDQHQEEHEQLQIDFELAQRNQQALSALLQHRRGEMQNLTGQVEAHKVESQMLWKMGNDAQAVVRQEAANMLTSQLAEITEDVMKLEARYESLQQKQTLLASLYAKSESRMGLLSHLARLCSAAVGHLLDARDAHDNHSNHMREAALAAVHLSKEEAALSAAETKVQELRESLEQLTADRKAAEEGHADDEAEDQDKLQRAINMAQAELMLAHRQRAEADKQVLAIRVRVAQAELAMQSSQLRITKARQRAEDAQQLVDKIRALLCGSTALIINREALQDTTGTALDASRAGPDQATFTQKGAADPSHPHGILAAVQLHSVTLQALTEATAKFIQALDCAATAEQRRNNALSSSQAAQSARDAAARQHDAAEELRAVAEGMVMVQQAHQLTGGRIARGNDKPSSHDGDRNSDSRSTSTGGQSTYAMSQRAVSAERDAAVIAELELERLQHEAAYQEAYATQERKLAACFLQQQKLLRLAGESLLDMARFGVAAELNAGPNMTADEASTLLSACKHLAEQHSATLLLGPAFDNCKHAEDYFKATLECVHEAKDLRRKAISGRLGVLQARRASYLQESNPALRALVHSTRSPRENGSAGPRGPPESAMLPPSPGEDEEAKSATQLAEYNQLLADEERMLMQVQELDNAATALLEESNSKAMTFATRWSEVIRPVQALYRLHCALAAGDTSCAADSGNVPKDASSPESKETDASLCGVLPDDCNTLPSPAALPSSARLQSHGGMHHAMSAGAEGFVGELSLRLMGPIAGLRDVDGQSRAGNACASAQPNLSALRQADATKAGTKLNKDGAGCGENDAELVIMAAETVARAKAAAAALAAKAALNFGDHHLPDQRQAEVILRQASGPSRNEPHAVQTYGHKITSLLARKAGQASHGTSRQLCASGSRRDAVAQAPDVQVNATATAATGSISPSKAPDLEIDDRGNKITWPAIGGESSNETLSSSLPSFHGNTVDRATGDVRLSAGGMHQQELPSHTTESFQLSKQMPNSESDRNTPRLGLSSMPAIVSDSPASSPGKGNVALPQLLRVQLPDNLDPATAAVLQRLWSTAALHYQRAQHMHDRSLQQSERQWQQCRAQLQMLQAEELKARSGGRLSEAGTLAAALAKWQQRRGHLNAAMRRHRKEFARYKALAYRATNMVERLQLTAMPGGTGSASFAMPQPDEALEQLLPRLSGSMLAGCGAMQSLERLHGELVQQVAALHATVAGLQQQSQRLFGKASRRSNKLKVQLGSAKDTAAHAVALAKSQSAAEQSAALGERAVELATHARTVQEHAARLSGESANCLQVLERLQHACDMELQAQHALVQAVDLLLCEAMQAVLRGERGPGIGLAPLGRSVGDATAPELPAQSEALTGDFDSLLQARHPSGDYLSAARAHSRRGEDVAQDAARAVQVAKEQLEQQMGPFARQMDDAATALAAISSARTAQCDNLRTRADAAAVCVARARSKLAAQRAARDSAAAEKYSRAAEGWAKQAEKLRKEALVTSAAAEEMGSRGQAIARLGARLRPIQEALDEYLDQQLEAWAAAALSRIQACGLRG